MKNDTKKKWLTAILLTFCTGLLLFFFYPSGSELGKSFVATSLYIMLRFAALIAGIILLTVWLFFYRKISSSLVYVFLVMLNLVICLSAVLLYFLREANREWLHDCLLNGLTGAGMILVSLFGKR